MKKLDEIVIAVILLEVRKGLFIILDLIEDLLEIEPCNLILRKASKQRKKG